MRSSKMAVIILILGFALSIGVKSNSDALTLTLFDGVNSKTISDGSIIPGLVDVNPDPGGVTFVGSLGVWSFNVTSVFTYPYPGLGSIDFAMMHLSDVSASSTGPGSLHITASEAIYNGPISADGNAGFIFSAGGVVSGTASFAAYLNSTSSLGTLGPFSAGAFSGSTSGFAAATTPFSLTIEADITHLGAGVSSFDATLQPVPEPATLLLLGSGLLGMGVFGRKKLRKPKA